MVTSPYQRGYDLSFSEVKTLPAWSGPVGRIPLLVNLEGYTRRAGMPLIAIVIRLLGIPLAAAEVAAPIRKL